MNPFTKDIECTTFGDPLFKRAVEIEKELKEGIKKPFDEVIWANIGDCHAMGQKPLTFIRQVLTLCIYPTLMDDDSFPDDVKRKADDILRSCSGGSIGSYSCSSGIEMIKEHIAQYIQKRDGTPSDYENITLTSGAIDGIQRVINLFSYTGGSKRPGIMVPIPQYPLYPDIIAHYKMHLISYYLDEDNAWEISTQELKRAIDDSRKVCEPRALVVINPGNPTGSLLTRENIVEIIKFAYDEKLFLMADEVYQDNICAEEMKFHSFKKVMMEMGEPYKNMELVSFMSASKGYMGECGLRGGYYEMVNIDPEVKKMLFKCGSARSCSNILGQAAMDCVVNPPQEGDTSYATFIKEKTSVLQSLKENAHMLYESFNKIEGIKCNRVDGAMYAFPQLMLPEKAIAKANLLEQEADFFYAMQLLENTGICVTPGSSFGQKPGSYHFRTTIILQNDVVKKMLKKFEMFHTKFFEDYK